MNNLLKLGKKIFTVGVVSTTIFWSLGVAALVPAVANAATVTDCAALMAGDFIKATGADIWVVNSDRTRSYFPNGDIFKSWTADNQYTFKTVSPDCMVSLKAVGAVYARPGTFLVKEGATDQLYVTLPGNKLAPISADAAKALYGSNYAATPAKGGRTLTMDNATWVMFSKTIGSSLTEAVPTEGSLVKVGSSYYVAAANKTLRSVDATGLAANRFQTKFAATLASTDGYSMGASVSAEEASLADTTQGMKGDGSISLPVVSGNVTVSLASDSPVSGTLISGQSIADLAHFNFSGNGTVTSLKLKRIGVSADTSLSNVYLYDGNKKIGDGATASNGMMTFANSAGLFTVAGSKTISVRADLAASTTGQTVGVALNAASDVGGTNASGMFPLSGNTFTIATVTDLATVSLSNTTNGPGANVNAGTSNVTLWSNSLSVGTRAVNLKYVSFKQVGSMPAGGLQNLRLYVNGVQVATAGNLDSSNVIDFDLSNSPVSLATGNRTLEVRGDVVNGSTRQFSLSLQTMSDLVLVDSNYGVNLSVSVSGGGNLPASPTATTVNGGSVSIQQDASYTVTQVVSNSSNVTLGKWTMKAYGEDVKVMSLTLTPSFSGASTTNEGINNLALYVNGGQVGSSQNWVNTSGGFPFTTTTYGSGNLFTLTAGQTVTVEAKGDLTLVDGTSVTGVNVTLGTPANQLQGVYSFNLSPSSVTTYSGQTLSLVTGALTRTKNPNFASQTVAPNVVKQKIGSFVIQASNAEPVRVTNIAVALFGSVNYSTQLANLSISEGNGQPVSPQSSNNFPVDFTLAANASKTIDVFADVGNTSGTVSTTLSVTAQGTSGTNASFSGLVGQTITVQNGTLNYPSNVTNNSLAEQYVLGGTDQSNFAVFNFKASGSPVVVDELAFSFGGTSVVAGDEPVTSVTINNMTFPVINHSVTTTNLNLTVPSSYAGLDLPVAVHFANVGQNAAEGGKTATMTLKYVKSHVGNTFTTTNTLSVSSNAVTLVASKPSVSVVASASKLSTGLVKVGGFTVTADAKGDISLSTTTLRLGTTGNTTVSSTAAKITEGNNTTAISGATVSLSDIAAGSTGSMTVAWGDYKIAAGTSKTFWVWVTAKNVSGDAGSQGINMQLVNDSANDFVWNDVEGDATGLTGTLLYSFPSESVSIYN